MKKLFLLLFTLMVSVTAEASDFGPETYSGKYNPLSICFIIVVVIAVLWSVKKQEQKEKKLTSLPPKKEED